VVTRQLAYKPTCGQVDYSTRALDDSQTSQTSQNI